MYQEHPAFEKPNDDTRIWRYLDFTEFVSLLDKQALFFTRADRLSDPFEGSYPKANVERRPGVYPMSKEAFDKRKETLEVLRRHIRRFVFVNCWHINEYESDAMWNLYLKSEEGIAVQSTFSRLAESLRGYADKEVYIGKVKYIDYGTEWLPERNLFYPFLHKRKSFGHERELRAIITTMLPSKDGKVDLGSLADDSPDDGECVSIDLDILIEKVSVSPMAPKWFGELAESVAAKYGLKGEIVQSSLSDDPVF